MSDDPYKSPASSERPKRRRSRYWAQHGHMYKYAAIAMVFFFSVMAILSPFLGPLSAFWAAMATTCAAFMTGMVIVAARMK